MLQYLLGSGLAKVADLEKSINDLSLTVVVVASVLLFILVGLSMLLAKHTPKVKPVLFGLIVTVVASTTLTISGATVYLNVQSATGGPVHWHADIEFWACGNELELRDPQGVLSNKIGTATYHEHNDKRIHLEGVPVTLPEDASLGKFLQVTGGSLSEGSLVVPLNDESYFEDGDDEVDGDGPGAPQPGLIKDNVVTDKDGRYGKFVNGQQCGDQPAEVQVFVYQYNEQDKTYRQVKLEHPAEYAISRHSEVPPGDCVIIEFAPHKDRTDKLCRQYGVRDIDRCEQFGVQANERRICEIKEVR